MDFFLSTSRSSVLCSVAAAGVLVHLIFNRTETQRAISLFTLLLAIPACLTALYLPHADSPILAVLIVFGLFWSTLITSILLYRVSPWHPLARYPGPFICKLSKFYLAFVSRRGKQYLYYYQLHKKYGDIVRVGPNEVSICNVDAVLPLMGPNGLEKGPFWSGRVSPQGPPPLITIVDKTEHARRRRSWTRGFTTASLKGYEVFVKARSLQLIDTISSKNLGETQDLTKWCLFFAYDIMMDLAFGGGSDMIRDGDVHGYWHSLERGQKDLIVTSHAAWLGPIVFSLPGFVNDIKAFRAHAQNSVKRRIQEGSPQKDLLYHLIDEDNLGTFKPTKPEVIGDAVLAMLAGSDTTSTATANILYFLISHPAAYKRLQAEIDGLGDKLTDCSEQAQLPYLTAVIYEGLRLLPIVMSGSQRTVKKGSGDRMIGPFYLPEGTHAFIPTYSLQRDPRCFSPFPDSFIPERWLPEDQREVLEPEIFNPQNEFINNNAAFLAFSVGPANCVGKNLAWMEMRMMIALVASRFNMVFEPGYDPQQWFDEIGDYYLVAKGKLPARLSIRAV